MILLNVMVDTVSRLRLKVSHLGKNKEIVLKWSRSLELKVSTIFTQIETAVRFPKILQKIYLFSIYIWFSI